MFHTILREAIWSPMGNSKLSTAEKFRSVAHLRFKYTFFHFEISSQSFLCQSCAHCFVAACRIVFRLPLRTTQFKTTPSNTFNCQVYFHCELYSREFLLCLKKGVCQPLSLETDIIQTNALRHTFFASLRKYSNGDVVRF